MNAELEAALRAWLRQYDKIPYADLVRLPTDDWHASEEDYRLARAARAAFGPRTVASESGATFLDLYDGKLDAALVYVDTAGLADAALEKPRGVYRLTAAQFRDICDRIGADNAKPGRDIADSCEHGTTGDRWFRMHPAVAAWVLDQEPVIETFAAIG